MFRDDMQANRAIRALFEAAGLPPLRGLWTADGPTARACELVEAGGGPLSHGEAVMLRVAFDAWNGEGKATVSELLHVLDSRRARLVCGLVLAAHEGGEAVERWIIEAGQGAS